VETHRSSLRFVLTVARPSIELTWGLLQPLDQAVPAQIGSLGRPRYRPRGPRIPPAQRTRGERALFAVTDDARQRSTSGNRSRTSSSRASARGPRERRPRFPGVHTCDREHLRPRALAAMQRHPAGRHAEGLGQRTARLLGGGATHRSGRHSYHEAAGSDLPPRPRARPHPQVNQHASGNRANDILSPQSRLLELSIPSPRQGASTHLLRPFIGSFRSHRPPPQAREIIQPPRTDPMRGPMKSL